MNLVRLCERRKMPKGPRHYVAVAMQVAVATSRRSQDLRDIAGDRRLLGHNGYGTGFTCRVAQVTSLEAIAMNIAKYRIDSRAAGTYYRAAASKTVNLPECNYLLMQAVRLTD